MCLILACLYFSEHIKTAKAEAGRMIHSLNRDTLFQLTPTTFIKMLVLREVSSFLSSGIYLHGSSLVQLLSAKAQS